MARALLSCAFLAACLPAYAGGDEKLEDIAGPEAVGTWFEKHKGGPIIREKAVLTRALKALKK